MTDNDLKYGECVHGNNMARCSECNGIRPVSLFETQNFGSEVMKCKYCDMPISIAECLGSRENGFYHKKCKPNKRSND